MSKKSEKLRATLKIDITIVPLFFQMSDLLVPKIEICLKYFFDKNFKSSHCDMYEVKSNFELQQVHRTKIWHCLSIFVFFFWKGDTPGPWTLAPVDFSGVVFTCAHFQKVAQISSLCNFYYIREGIPSLMRFWLLMT